MDSEPSPRLYRSVRLLIVTLIKLHYILERNNMFQLSLSVCLRLAQWMWHSRHREACGWWTTTTGASILVATSSTPRWDPMWYRFLTAHLTIQTQVRAGACLSPTNLAKVFNRQCLWEKSEKSDSKHKKQLVIITRYYFLVVIRSIWSIGYVVLDMWYWVCGIGLFWQTSMLSTIADQRATCLCWLHSRLLSDDDGSLCGCVAMTTVRWVQSWFLLSIYC